MTEILKKKNIAFSVYSFFFNFGAICGVKNNHVALVSMHNANFKDGLGEVLRVIKEDCIDCEILKIDRKDLFSRRTALKALTLDAFRLGRSKYIFLNDNFMPLAKARPAKETKIVQLWHGQGAFKKFGLSIEQPDEIRERERAANEKLSYVVCSSAGVADIYKEAFGVDEQKIIPTGTPNEDYYFHDESQAFARARVYKKYPELKDKFVILYAPTFRDGMGDAEILKNFDASKIEALVDNSVVVTRLHPQVHESLECECITREKFGINVTDYDSINELCIVADLLITDYSSVCMDFALMEKPVLFYAFDLDSYKYSRNFYFDYRTYVPGPIATNKAELLKILKSGELMSHENRDKLKAFRAFNFDSPDGSATRKLFSQIGLK